MDFSNMCQTLLCALLLFTKQSDTAPTFNDGATGKASIAENSAIGILVTTVTATAGDSGAITYSIKSQTPKTPVVFAIFRTNGSLTVAGAIDFETTKNYTVVVRASEASDPVATADKTLNITITNVNEEPPSFASKNTNVRIDDKAGKGTNLTTVSATDPDIGDTIVYGVTAASNTNADFTINTVSGLIKTAKVMNRTKTATYNLNVTATDGAKLVGSTILSVCVGSVDVCAAGASALCCGYIALLVLLFIMMIR